MAGEPQSSAANRSANSSHEVVTRSGWPTNSSWYQPHAISLAISGQASRRRSTGVASASVASGPKKRGSGGRPPLSW